MLNKAVYDFAMKIMEAARINAKETDTEFPSSEYKVYVKRINPRLRTPMYVNVESKAEGYHVLISTAGKLIQVKKHGNRKNGDRFSDVCEKVKSFMKEKSGLSEKFDNIEGSNVEHVVKVLWKMTEAKYA